MHGNWITMTATATAANSNPTTISAVSNYPTFADVFGTSGTRCVEYEMDDGAGHFEAGIGVLTLSTLSLARSFPAATYDTGATPKYVNAPAVPLTDFSATVNVRCSPLASSFQAATPFSAAFIGVAGLGNAYMQVNTTNTAEDNFQLNGWRNFFPFLWTGSRPINSCSISITTAGTGSVLVGIMELQGSTLNLIADVTANAGFDATVTGIQTLTAPTDFAEFFLPPGPYVVQMVPTGGTTPTMTGIGQRFSAASSFLGTTTNLLPITLMLDGAGDTTLAMSATAGVGGFPGGGGGLNQSVPHIVFGMA